VWLPIVGILEAAVVVGTLAQSLPVAGGLIFLGILLVGFESWMNR
jgi:hypothetical protein